MLIIIETSVVILEIVYLIKKIFICLVDNISNKVGIYDSTSMLIVEIVY